MKVVLANPRGFCAGVDRAIEIVERALARTDEPVYVRHEIVHNRRVVDDLHAKGAVFVEEPDQAPTGAQLIYSAHGVSPAVRELTKERGLRPIDATCPLVTKVHREVHRMRREGLDIVMIGHAGHVEVEGTMGQAPGSMYLVEKPGDVAGLKVRDASRLGCVTQTTLSVDDTREVMKALKARFPSIELPRRDDICYATQNRQNAVKELAAQAELVLIVGAPASSNSNRLVEVATKLGVPSYLITEAADIDPAWIEGLDCVGVSAGASTPEFLVAQVVEHLCVLAGDDSSIESLPVIDEGMHFKLPPELRDLRPLGPPNQPSSARNFDPLGKLEGEAVLGRVHPHLAPFDQPAKEHLVRERILDFPLDQSREWPCAKILVVAFFCQANLGCRGQFYLDFAFEQLGIQLGDELVDDKAHDLRSKGIELNDFIQTIPELRTKEFLHRLASVAPPDRPGSQWPGMPSPERLRSRS